MTRQPGADFLASRLTGASSCGDHFSVSRNHTARVPRLEEPSCRQLEAKPFSVRGVVDTCRRLLAEEALKKSLAFEVEVASAMPDLLMGDAVQLQQVLSGLLGNAIHFTSTGRVRVHVVPLEGNRFLLEISDTGAGIAKGRIPHLFERSGSGLSAIQRLVGLMDGKIWVKSKEGEGSVFTVVLPLRVAEDSLPPLCLLVVDDVDVNRDLIRAFLEDQPVEIVEASHGQQAIDLCAQRRFDLVLMDVEMPEMNGMEAMRRIHEAEKEVGRRSTPVYALTAHALKDQQASYLKAGARQVITKPIRRNELMAALRKGEATLSADFPVV